jgi:hypothetical protein
MTVLAHQTTLILFTVIQVSLLCFPQVTVTLYVCPTHFLWNMIERQIEQWNPVYFW